MKRVALIIALAVLFAACRPSVRPVATPARPNSLEPTWFKAQQAYINAEGAKSKDEMARWAKEGIELAEKCVMESPEEAACFYYRAINTGLYYKAHVVGYQTGLKQMISDLKRAVKLDPSFENAGAYRALGEIYSMVPETTLNKNAIRRDLDLSENYLKQAVEASPEYPENYLTLADVLFEKARFREAEEALNRAMELTSQWRSHRDYVMWREEGKELSKKLKGRNQK